MNTVITLTRYMCSICGSEHRDFQSAQQCVRQPLPQLMHKPGEMLRFENHTDSPLGTMISTTEGRILACVPCSLKSGGHSWYYLVDALGCDVEVIQFPDGKLISPAANKFQKGHARDLVNRYRSMGLSHIEA